MLKLGYKASAEQFGPTELLQYSRLAEQSGFDSVFISDHFQPWKHHGGHAPFSLAWLGPHESPIQPPLKLFGMRPRHIWKRMTNDVVFYGRCR